MEISSSDVSLSFLLLYDYPSVSLFPFHQCLSYTYETAPEKSFCFLLKFTFSNPWSYCSSFCLLDTQSLSADEIIPDLNIMEPSTKQQGMKGCQGGTRALWVFSLVMHFANEWWNRFSALQPPCTVAVHQRLESDCGSVKAETVSQKQHLTEVPTWQQPPAATSHDK